MSENEKPPVVIELIAVLKKYNVDACAVQLYTEDADNDAGRITTYINGKTVHIERAFDGAFQNHPQYFNILAGLILNRAVEEMGMMDEFALAAEKDKELKAIWNSPAKGEA